MKLPLPRSLFAFAVLLAICPPSFAAMLSFSVGVQSLNGDFTDPASYAASAFIFMPGTSYEMTSHAGSVTISPDGTTGSSSSANYDSWAELVAAETGQWKLTTNPGQGNETTYFFNVGFGDIAPTPQPFWIDAYHIAGTPADQARVPLSGPLDPSYLLFYSANSPGGSPSDVYTMAGGQSFIDLTIPPDFTTLFLGASRTTYTNAFSISTPTTTGGDALADWTLSPYNGYIEGGTFFTANALRSVSVPDSTGTLLLLLAGVSGLVAMRRAASRA